MSVLNIRGVRFEISSDFIDFNDILKNISIEDYVWNLGQSELYIYSHSKKYNRFSKQIIYGKKLTDILERIYLIVFADIKAFPNKKSICIIRNYDEFLNSSCEFALFISDGNYVEIYAKQEIHCKIIFNNALQLQCDNLEYITTNNDYRTKFNVY